jgi:hypothetical protein
MRHVNILRERQEFTNGLPISGRDQLNRMFGKFRKALAAALTIVSAMMRLEWMASFPPRRIVALPDLKQRLAASAVTFGRDS